MKRQIRTLADAKSVLEPYYDQILQSMQKSFEQYLGVKDFIIKNQGFFELKPRTKANLISDFIETHIKETFTDDADVTPGIFNDVFGLNIKNEFFVRFKKMDKSFKTGNVNTKQQVKLQNQHTITGFPDQPTFVFAGYIPDAMWNSVNGYYVACWDGKSLEWFDQFGNISYEQLVIKFDTSESKLHEKIEEKIKLNTKVIPLKAEENHKK